MDKKRFDEMLKKASPLNVRTPAWSEVKNQYDGRIVAVTYRGAREDLAGKRALFRREFGKFLVQFDDMSLPQNLTHGWTEFPEEDFILEVQVDWKDSHDAQVG